MTPSVSRVDRRAGVVLAASVTAIAAGGTVLAIHDGNRLKSLDESAFVDLAGNLAFHGAFAHTNTPEIEGYDPRLPGGELRPTAYRAPGYAWLLAPLRRVGGGLALLRVLNYALLALTLWSLHSLLVRHAGLTGGLAGIVLVFCYPVLLYAAGTLYPQTLAAFLLVASAGQLDRLGPSSPLRRFFLAGLCWGALVLTVPVFLALLPVVAAWLLWSRRGTRAQTAALVLAAVLPAVFWSARNTAALGAPCGIATSSGFNLLAGNGPYVRYDQATGELRWPGGVRERVLGKGEVERDRIMARAALDWMRENPGSALILYAQKLLYWFSFRNRLVSDRVIPGGAAAGPQLLRDLLMFLGYGLLAAILFLRIARARRHPLSALEILLLALYAGAALVYAVYFPRIRFRLPFDWLLIALDSMFLARAVEDAQKKRSRISAPSSGAASR